MTGNKNQTDESVSIIQFKFNELQKINKWHMLLKVNVMFYILSVSIISHITSFRDEICFLNVGA